LGGQNPKKASAKSPVRTMPAKRVVITSLGIILFDDKLNDDNLVITSPVIILFDDNLSDDKQAAPPSTASESAT
jgi:hypothetical protein